MSTSETITPYVPVQYSPQVARLFNLMAGRRVQAEARIGKCRARISLQPGAGQESGVPSLSVLIQDRLWQMSFGHTRYFYSLLEAADPGGFFDDTPPESLPGEILWAIVESFAGEELARLESRLGTPAALAEPVPVNDEALNLSLIVEFEAEDGSPCKVPGTLYLPSEDACLDLLEKLVLETPKKTWPLERIQALSREVALVAGFLRLSSDDVSGLEQGDVLIPELWLPRENRLGLGMGSAPLICAMDTSAMTLTSEGFRAILPGVVKGARNEKREHTEIEEDNIPMENEETQNLELDLVFELGRISMTVAQIGTLASGEIIPLPRQPQEGVGVDIRVNNQVVAKGKIVSVGQDVGIQITQTGN